MGDLSKLADDVESSISQELSDTVALWDSEDPMGMKTRFATDKMGKEELLQNIQKFDLASFVQRQTQVLEELDRLIMTLTNYDEWKNEQNDPSNW